jgi:thiamine monophosphate kinase
MRAARDTAAITEIGRVVSGGEAVLMDREGSEIAVPKSGYTHF